MPFHKRKFNIGLTPSQPTQMTVQGLKAQLNHLGLTCPASNEEFLEQYIQEVRGNMPNGVSQAWKIVAPDGNSDTPFTFDGNMLEDAASGSWQADHNANGYATELATIQTESVYDWLLNQPGRRFIGKKTVPKLYTDKTSTPEAIKALFNKSAWAAAEGVVDGVSKADIEAAMSDALDHIQTIDKNIDTTGSRILFLVKNYNPETQEADAVGVFTIAWRLQVENYVDKKQKQYDTTISFQTRTAFYSTQDDLDADYAAAIQHLQTADLNQIAAIKAIPIRSQVVKIFDSKPAANLETFKSSVPKSYNDPEKLTSIVLYSPNMSLLAAIDNTESQATASYQKSVTSGFTFSSTQSISAGASLAASVEVLTAEYHYDWSITFSEEYSRQTEETFSAEVPPGKKAFVYQGTLVAQLLDYSPATGKFSWGETSNYMTDVLVTLQKPLN